MKSLLPVLLVLVLAKANEVADDRGGCGDDAWTRRDLRQADVGPFWANRGKREPKYLYNRLFAEVPEWIVVTMDPDKADYFDYDPYFTARGKKEAVAKRNLKIKGKSGKK